MELLAVHISYSEPGVDMTASGTIGSRTFHLDSDGSQLHSRVKVNGFLGTNEISLEGRTKNLINRHFQVSGTWVGAPIQLSVKVKRRNFRIQGAVGDESLQFVIKQSYGGELNTEPAPGHQIDLRFHDIDVDPRLEGSVGTVVEGVAYAALIPCMVRSLHGSIGVGPAHDTPGL